MLYQKEKTAAILCFSGSGLSLARQVLEIMQADGWEINLFQKSRHAAAEGAGQINLQQTKEDGGNGKTMAAAAWPGSVQEWAKVNFSRSTLIFIGASGIAVRAVAPFVKDKMSDPAVLVLDEGGRFVIPILSGHIGGANELAVYLAGRLSAEAVITTATDVHGKFAVDLFAKKNHLWISDRRLAKDISAAVLEARPVLLSLDPELQDGLAGSLPAEELIFLDLRKKRPADPAEELPPDPLRIHVGIRRDDFLPGRTLYLVPEIVTIGIGCKKGTPVRAIRNHVLRVLEMHSIFIQAVHCAASIDLKKEEPGLLRFVQEQGWELRTFSAEELKAAPGSYVSSSFVESVTGVDNVCERSAVLAASAYLRNGKREEQTGNPVEPDKKNTDAGNPDAEKRPGRGVQLIVPKTAGDGVTAALACVSGSIIF